MSQLHRPSAMPEDACVPCPGPLPTTSGSCRFNPHFPPVSFPWSNFVPSDPITPFSPVLLYFSLQHLVSTDLYPFVWYLFVTCPLSRNAFPGDAVWCTPRSPGPELDFCISAQLTISTTSFFVLGTVLCIVRCPAASLASSQ